MLTPTQRDREAAWPHKPSCFGNDHYTTAAWYDGRYDYTSIIQAFARHAASAIEQAAEALDDRAHDHLAGCDEVDLALAREMQAMADRVRSLNTDTKDGRDGIDLRR